MSLRTDSSTGTIPDAVERPSRATVAGLSALLLVPIAATVAAITDSLVLGDVDTEADPAAFLTRVAENTGLWSIGAVALLAMALLTIAWVPAVWRVSMRRSPVWAWVAAVMGTLFAGGQVVHLVSWMTLSPVLAALDDADAALALTQALDDSWFFLLIFTPFLLGAALALPFAAVALFRAKLVPGWSIVAVAVASAAIGVLGTSHPIMMVAYPVLIIGAFAPAAVRAVRRRA